MLRVLARRRSQGNTGGVDDDGGQQLNRDQQQETDATKLLAVARPRNVSDKY